MYPSSSVGPAMSAQFTSLVQHVDNVRNVVGDIDRECGNVVKQVDGLKEENRKLIHESRELRAVVGGFDQQRKLWEEERDRLKHQKEDESQQLVACTQESKEYEKEEHKRQEQYCLDVKKLNENHESLLRKQERCRLKTMLCPETATRLRQLWVEKEQQDQQQIKGEVQSASGKDTEMEDCLEDTAALWHQAMESWNQQKVANEELEQKVMHFRGRVLEDRSKHLTEEKLMEKEQLWVGANYQGAGIDPNSFEDQSSNQNNVFFYGHENDSAMTEETGLHQVGSSYSVSDDSRNPIYADNHNHQQRQDCDVSKSDYQVEYDSTTEFGSIASDVAY